MFSKSSLQLKALLCFWTLASLSQLLSAQQAELSKGHQRIQESLVAFLSAKNLQERIPYMTKSKRSKINLEDTVLAEPLPKATSISFTNRIDNLEYNRREYFFSVTFDHKEDIDTHPPSIYIQISEWGDLDNPRVHTDAFLDLYSQKLQTFAAKVNKETLTLHAVVDSYRYTFDTNIPNHKTMGFLKARCHPKEPAFLKAYFPLGGPLFREINHPRGLPWATPGLATITVAWNTDDPAKPYLRLLKINGFTWDP